MQNIDQTMHTLKFDPQEHKPTFSVDSCNITQNFHTRSITKRNFLHRECPTQEDSTQEYPTQEYRIQNSTYTLKSSEQKLSSEFRQFATYCLSQNTSKINLIH